MYTIFFKTTGMVQIDCLEKGTTVTSDYYIENCLNPVIKEINKHRPPSGTTSMKFLHDNARPHVTKAVKTHLNEAGFTIIRHPPNSPDLAPSDFWLFDQIKTNLDDHASVKSQKSQITRILKNISKDEYKKLLKNGWSECNFVQVTMGNILNI
jgi:histone-lysine N-methyltransferase SETMAR